MYTISIKPNWVYRRIDLVFLAVTVVRVTQDYMVGFSLSSSQKSCLPCPPVFPLLRTAPPLQGLEGQGKLELYLG